jgi:metal-responsive CopG/Arc/MetJ family transcriptional regulator
METITSTTVRVNVSMPKDVLAELQKLVPAGRKSGFIADAVEKELATLKRKKALEEFATLPPTFAAIEDSVAYVRTLRGESEKRLKRFGL